MIWKLQSGSAFILSALVALPLLSWQSEPARIDSPQHQLQLAVSYYNSEHYQDAARVLEDLAQRVPGNYQVEELMGLVYSAQGKDREACLHFEKAVRLNPNSAPLRTNLAVSLARLGKNDLAEAEFKKAVETEPGNFSVNHNFGEFYARNGNAQAAIPYLRRAQQARPSSYGNGYDLALAYVRTGMWEDARQQIRALIKIKDAAELHDLMGEVEEKKGNYVAAANEYQRAAQMDPSETNIFYWGSELLLHQTWDPAIEVFSKGVERYPNSQRLVVGLGLSLFWSGRYDEAVKALVRATDLAPDDPRPYYFLSKAYQHSRNQADEVIKRFRRFAELRPQDGQAAYYYAMSLWKGKESDNNGPALEQAESLLKRAIHLSPAFAEAHLALANLYSQERKYAEAVLEYQRAIKLDAKLADAYYRLGQAYVHLNRPDLAKKEFEVHDQLYRQHLADWDNRQRDVLRFVVSQRSSAGTRP